jgi:phosphoglycolate phosphatase
MIKAIIFDLDGTLLHTIEDIRSSVNHALLKYGFESISAEFAMESVGHGAYEMIQKATHYINDKQLIDQVYEAYQSHYDQFHTAHTTPYEGIEALLKQLKKHYLLGVLSNKHHYLVQDLLEVFFPNLFDAHLGAVNERPIKPNLEMPNYLIEALKVSPNEVIYIGDSEPDVIVAQKMGFHLIAVDYGYRTRETLQALHPQYLVSNVEALKNTIERIIQNGHY